MAVETAAAVKATFVADLEVTLSSPCTTVELFSGFCSTASVVVLLTNRPFTLNRRSARFFRQLYRIFLFHTRRVLLLWNLAMIAALSAGV